MREIHIDQLRVKVPRSQIASRVQAETFARNLGQQLTALVSEGAGELRAQSAPLRVTSHGGVKPDAKQIARAIYRSSTAKQPGRHN